MILFTVRKLRPGESVRYARGLNVASMSLPNGEQLELIVQEVEAAFEITETK